MRQLDLTVEGKNIYQEILEDSGLYPHTVIENWGRTDSHWRSSNHIKRKHSLRHDMMLPHRNVEKLKKVNMKQGRQAPVGPLGVVHGRLLFKLQQVMPSWMKIVAIGIYSLRGCLPKSGS